MNDKWQKLALMAQQTEITEHAIYMKLAEKTRDSNNADVQRQIGGQELEHAAFWETTITYP